MKQKTATIILMLTIVINALIVVPKQLIQNYYVLKLIVLVLGGGIITVFFALNHKTLKLDKKDILILIFLGLVLISTILSSNITKSIIGQKNRYEGLLSFISYISIYLFSKKYFDKTYLKKFINIMFYVSMVIGIFAILQNYIKIDLDPIFNKGVCSTFGNSNFFGSYISIVLPIAMAIFIFYGSKKSFILGIIMFFNMISSGTRSAWAAFGIIGILGIIYLIKERKWKFFKRAIILLGCFILIFSCLYKDTGSVTKRKINNIKSDINKIKGIDPETDQIGSGRIAIWRWTLNVIKEKPIIGCGTDNLFSGLLEYGGDEYSAIVKRTNKASDKAHNEYLQIAATIGVPALIIYLVFIGKILVPKVKVMYRKKSYFIISAVIISYLVQAFFNISTIGIAPIFWMVLGLTENRIIVEELDEIMEK